MNHPGVGIKFKRSYGTDSGITCLELIMGESCRGPDWPVHQSFLCRPVVTDNNMRADERCAGSTTQSVGNLIAIHALSMIVMIVTFLEPFINYEPLCTFEPEILAKSSRVFQRRAVNTTRYQIVFIGVVVQPFRNVATICLVCDICFISNCYRVV